MQRAYPDQIGVRVRAGHKKAHRAATVSVATRSADASRNISLSEVCRTMVTTPLSITVCSALRTAMRSTVRVAALLSVACIALSTPAGAQRRTSGIDTTNFDRSVRPQDDFFRYVNGGWLKKTPIDTNNTWN